MARAKKYAGGQSRTVSFRLAESDFAAFRLKSEVANMTATEFFRDCILANKTQVVARPVANKDYERLLFVFNKSSNNLNQLAYRANTDHLAGMLSEKTYLSILDNLELIARYMKAGI